MPDHDPTPAPLSHLRLTLVVMWVVSTLFPLLFAAVNGQYTPVGLLSSMVVNAVLFSGISLLVHAGLRAAERVVRRVPYRGLVYLVAFGGTQGVVYWLLKGVYYLLVVRTGSQSGAWEADWQFRYFIGINTVATAFVFLFRLGLTYAHLTQQKMTEADKVQTEFAQVRLQALHHQVNPHFLFNSLSVLSTLVQTDPPLSEKFIVQLSVVYRYILEQQDYAWVDLEAELAFLEAYFFLLQIRFGRKIELRQQVAPDQLVRKMPPFTLQLLVENAVKHNKMSVAEPLVIRLCGEGDKLVVENNLNPRTQPAESTGIGLDNIRKRYAFATGQPVTVRRTDRLFAVTLPLLTP